MLAWIRIVGQLTPGGGAVDKFGRATRITLFSFAAPHMRAFHMSWIAFFTVFFAWFGVAPLMPVIREDLGLTQVEIGNTIVGSVAATVLARILIGPLCDRFGARRTYTALLLLGSVPVLLIGLARSYEAFLLFRIAIGAIGAAFVITQYHTSVMFAPNCVGTANATTAGWGNLGGGVTQIVMPLILAAFVLLGFREAEAWRMAMVVPGVALVLLGVAYYFLTQDSPAGNVGTSRTSERSERRATAAAVRRMVGTLRDPRVWILCLAYGACFGVELTINNVAALYFHDRFALDLRTAGLVAGSFGLMNLFARTLGGWLSDRVAIRRGSHGRARLLASVLLAEGVAIVAFSRVELLGAAVAALLIFSIFVQMAEGATFGLVPFVRPRAIGAVAGVVGAGGNVGAVAAGFLFRSESLRSGTAFLYLGVAVVFVGLLSFALRFRDIGNATADGAADHRAVKRPAPTRKRVAAPA